MFTLPFYVGKYLPNVNCLYIINLKKTSCIWYNFYRPPSLLPWLLKVYNIPTIMMPVSQVLKSANRHIAFIATI